MQSMGSVIQNSQNQNYKQSTLALGYRANTAPYRLLMSFLALLLAMSLMPVSAFAAEPDLSDPSTETAEEATPPTEEATLPAEDPILSEEPASIAEGPDSAEPAVDIAADEIVPQDITNLSGLYTIQSARSSADTPLMIDVPGASQDSSVRLQVYADNFTPAQRFRFDYADGYYTITNINSGKVLDVSGGKTVSGTPVWQYHANGTDAQKWRVVDSRMGDGTVYLVSKVAPATILDLSDASAVSGTKLQITSSAISFLGVESSVSDSELGVLATNYVSARFKLNPIKRTMADGIYTLASAKSATAVLDVAGGQAQNGTNVQLYTTNSTNAQKWHFRYDGATGYYTIIGQGSNMALDVAGAKGASGTNVQIYRNNNTVAQKWVLTELPEGSGNYGIRSACGGFALDAQGGGVANGTNVWIYRDNGTAAQRWTFRAVTMLEDGLYTFASPLGKVLDVKGGSKVSGADIQMYTANNTFAQKWLVTAAGDGYYRIESVNSGNVLDVRSGSGPSVQVYTSNSSAAQLWKPELAGENGFGFRNKATGLMLDVVGGSSAQGAGVQVYRANGTTAQRWVLNRTEYLNDGATYTIATASDAQQVLDIAGGSREDGALLQTYQSNGTAAQRFRVNRVGTNTYSFENRGSIKSLERANDGSNSVRQNTNNGGIAQRWSVVYLGLGKFKIVSMTDQTTALTVLGAAANWTPIGVRPADGSAAQSFVFSQVANSGKQPLDGIDVSSWQPANIGSLVDYDFMIVKATQGTTYFNPNFSQQANTALNRNKKLGIYHFANGGTNPQAEAQFFVSKIRGYVGGAILILDYEGEALGNGREWVRSFMREVKQLTGVTCGLYCSSSYIIGQNLNGLCQEEGALLWNANYRYNYEYFYAYNQTITPGVPCQIYQYTSSGRLPGYNNNLDLNVFYGSEGDWDWWCRR